MVKKTTSVNFGQQRQHKWLQTLLQNSTRESTWVTCNVKLLSMTPLSVWWLTKHRQNSSIEPLILAAQDDCMGNAGNTHCHQCGQGGVTVWHILSHCHPKRLVHFLHGAARLCSVSSLLWPTYASTTVQEKHCLKIPLEHPHPHGHSYCGPPSRHPSPEETDRTSTSILLRWLLPETLSRKNKELRSSSSSLRTPEEKLPGYRLDIVLAVTHCLVGSTAGKTVSQIDGMQQSVVFRDAPLTWWKCLAQHRNQKTVKYNMWQYNVISFHSVSS